MKNIKTRISCVLLLTVLYSTCFAQPNYKKALIVNMAGDTVTGFINYREWSRNPAEFSFRLSVDDKNTARYTVDDVQFVEIEGFASYRRFRVMVSMNEVEFSKLTESASQPEISDTVFLQLLADGNKLSLYSYRDQLKQRFYILEKDAPTPVELGYKVALINGSVIKYPTYRNQLIKLDEKLNDSMATIRNVIEEASYRREDIVKITRLLNGETGSHVISPVARKKSRHFFLAAGINYSSVMYGDKNVLTSDGVDNNDNRLYRNRRTGSFLPLVVIGTDVYSKWEIRKLFLRLELSAAGFSSEVHSLYKFSMYTAEELKNNYQLSGLIFSFRPQLLANILNKENLKVYLGAGPSLHYLIPMKNELYQETNMQGPGYSDKQTDDYLQLKSMFANVMVRSGVALNKKVDISVSWFSPVELDLKMASSTSAKYSSYQLAVAYKFLR